MKSLKSLLAMLLLLAAMFAFAACDSKEEPLPDKYAGIYGSGQYGNLIVTTTTVATDQLLLPQCVVGDTTISWELVSWEPVSFYYYSDKTFTFDAYVESITSSTEGVANFSGSFAENNSTYDIYLKYYGNSEIWFAKSK